MIWLTMGWVTSASNRKVAVSDQSRAETLIVCPPWEKSESILVNGHGPAIHDARGFRNSFPVPASRVAEPCAARHLPSGEHGRCPLHGTLPVFSTWNVFTALPTLNSVIARPEYLTRTFATFTAGPVAEGVALGSATMLTM